MLKRTWGIGLITAAALILAGCSNGDDVATLNGDQSASSQTQADRARDMVKCLNDAGIEATAEDYGSTNGDLGLQFDSTKPYALSYGNGGSEMGGGNATTEAEQEAIWEHLNELVAKYDPYINGGGGAEMVIEAGGAAGTTGGTVGIGADPSEASDTASQEPSEQPGEEPSDEPSDGEEVTEEFPVTPPYLIIGDQDYTESFVKCLEETGFTEPEYHVDPAEEIEQKQLTLEATNEWIKCARENGYPNLKDPPAPKADEWMTQPTAVLPVEITPAELRALLEVCPNFNEEDHKAVDDATMDLDYDAMTTSELMDFYRDLLKQYPGATDPQIGFDVPGWDGTSNWSDEVDQATMDKLDELQQVLYEKINAYYESLSPEIG
ncbi:MAG: hypothetical protein LBJ62_07675 [Bifidobacteriaceae bacterium]|jgi:hypothetical protein|nr:hypothetical protein [Bifidobacteriaceae bacterium]